MPFPVSMRVRSLCVSFFFCLQLVDQDISSQLLLQLHTYPATMLMDSLSETASPGRLLSPKSCLALIIVLHHSNKKVRRKTITTKQRPDFDVFLAEHLVSNRALPSFQPSIGSGTQCFLLTWL